MIRYLAAVALALTLPGWHRAAAQQQQSPRLVQLDSVILGESESLYVGLVNGFAMSAAGRYYVTDVANFVVHEFARDGQHMRTFGRQGRGPGEFTAPGALTVVGDTLLLVYGDNRIAAFDLRSGRFASERSLPGRPDGLSITHDGQVIASSLVPLHRASLRVFGGATDSVRYAGPYPFPYGRNQIVDDVFGHAMAATFGRDSVAVAFHATEYAFIGRLSSPSFDSVHIGRRARNGAPARVIGSLPEDPGAIMPYAYALSAPWALGRLSGSRLGYMSVGLT